MDSAACNNIFTLPPWILFLVIALIPAVAFYLRYRKFQEEMEEYRYWKNKRTEFGEEIEEVDLPDYHRFLTVEVFLALLAFGTALLGFLSTNNITYAFTVNQTCIVSQAITPIPTLLPTLAVTGEATMTSLPSSTYTATPTPFHTPTYTATSTPTYTSTYTATSTVTHTPTYTVMPTLTHTLTATMTSTVTATPQRFYMLPINDGVYWPDGYNVGLQTTENAVATQVLSGIPFEIGRQINTAGCSRVVSIDDSRYVLRTNINNPQSVYFLIQAGYGFPVYEGNAIGQIELRFSEGAALTEELILGFNIRDWARDKDPKDAVMTITSDMTTAAWEGPAGGSDQGAVGGMDILTIDIPENYQGFTLESITLEDTTMQNNGTDAPCIHLQAVTVEVNN